MCDCFLPDQAGLRHQFAKLWGSGNDIFNKCCFRRRMHNMRILPKISSLLCTMVLICGCQGGKIIEPNSGFRSDPQTEPKGVIVRPGLALNVQVLASGQKEVDEKNRRISEICSLSLPLIGEVVITNMTVREIQAKLTKLYCRYYVDPQVIVEGQIEQGDTAVSPWGYVTILGRVKKPGQVNIPPTSDLTVSRAVQLAGGLDTSANNSAIIVTRKVGNANKQFEVNLDRVGAMGLIKEDIILIPGDVVYVPEMIF
jgi:polysaccharide export outer membrane protein